MNHTVAFLDILGFKKLVEERPTQELGEKFVGTVGRMLPAFNKPYQFKSKEPTLFPSSQHATTWCTRFSFSDSIIHISHDDSEAGCLMLLVYTLRSMQTLLATGFAVRGGVTFGEMFIDRKSSLFLGKALTDAFTLEQSQDWIGASLDPSIEIAHPSLFRPEREHGGIINALFPRYQVPMKSGSIREYRTINWRWNLVVKFGTRSLFPQNDDWAVKRKIDNTLRYAKYIRDIGHHKSQNEKLTPVEVRPMYVADSDPTPTPISHGDEL